ncbi:GNAT family N-acetyltransferase [Streptomyces mayteni]
MRIRPGTRHDADRIAVLHADSWRAAYAGILPDDYLNGPLLDDRLAVWRKRLTDDPSAAGLLVAEDENAGELTGFAYLVPSTDGRVLLDNLHAHPGHVRTGIGRRLLRRALDWAAAEHPGRPLYLEVLRANAPAIAFYERQGGRRTDARTARFDQGFELPVFEYTWTET